MCTLSQRDVYSDGRCNQMILEEYIFTSCFLNDIQGLIEQKKQSGYIYDSAKYILIQFDKFCVENHIDRAIAPCNAATGPVHEFTGQ